MMQEMDSSNMPVILCCLCGVEIHQNPSNMCVSCLRSSVDITEGLNRSLTIHSCRSCGRLEIYFKYYYNCLNNTIMHSISDSCVHLGKLWH